MLEGSRNFIDNKNFKNYYLIFLTVRRLETRNNTKTWLKKNNFFRKRSSLFLVGSPADKVYFFDLAKKSQCEVSIFDDLSYNHENGKPLFYDDIIKFIEDNKIDYFGYSFIMHINKR